MRILIIPAIMIFLSSCSEKPRVYTVAKEKNKREHGAFHIYTEYSNNEDKYSDFNSAKAINRIAEIENEYFNYSKRSFSKYYGTNWYESCCFESNLGHTPVSFEDYKDSILQRGEKPDSMHCTIYAVEALRSGFGDQFSEIERIHRRIWNDREYAGWSIGYILVNYFHWKAYLIINEFSSEYKRCKKNYYQCRSYYVWNQPDFKIEKMYHSENDADDISELLKQNEFGWGFSNQGIHTWITRYDTLKECIWSGSPSEKYFGYGELFKKTRFNDFHDYDSNIVFFPPDK